MHTKSSARKLSLRSDKFIQVRYCYLQSAHLGMSSVGISGVASVCLFVCLFVGLV